MADSPDSGGAAAAGAAFVPRRFLRNGHLQTLAGNFLPRENRLPAAEDLYLEVEPGTQILCQCHWQPERASRPAVVIVHGLEGSSDSQYVIGNGSRAWAAGMSVVRMNMRSCGGAEHLSPTLYHSGRSGDVAAVVRHLIDAEGVQRIGAIGYSMGGNLVLKMAGDWGEDAPRELIAVATVSPAADLGASVDALHAPVNRIYEWKFLFGLMRRYKRKIELFPHIYQKTPRYPRSLRDLDDLITAPHSGFADAEDYYTRAASARVIDRIARPALVIHSTDDPFVRLTPETRAKMTGNTNIMLIETAHGGHCAFLADPNGAGGDHDDGRWAEQRILEFFLKNGMA